MIFLTNPSTINKSNHQAMELSLAQSERFSFGDAANTEYVTYEIIDTEHKLPYHPFRFDLKLIIWRNKPNYEDINTEYPLSRDTTTVFCRKKKVNKEWNDPLSTPVYLSAEIISEKHFSIDEHYVLRDLGSKHGTYFWVDRAHPRKIEPSDTFLIAKQPLMITRVVHLPKPTIQMTYKGQTLKIPENKKLYLIGSHPKCDLVIGSLHHFQVCINVTTFTIFTHLDEEDASPEHGLWFKLRKERKQEIVLQHGNLVMVEPYIFRLQS